MIGPVQGSDLEGQVFLLHNVLLLNSEIDCLLLYSHGMIVLDLKAYLGEVRGEEEDLRKIDAWSYFLRGSTYPDGQIDRAVVTWFRVVIRETLVDQIRLVNSGYTLRFGDLVAIAEALRPPQEGGVFHFQPTPPSSAHTRRTL
ncbi:nuclease-related domain-containing protein [Methanosphaerula palustris]|uniref:NERD domain-containing protein n=1 Tax=Methanosphaerula palustris (strain ATCC BAA-1556 / DSM 19958 / E1-9c) TaxID=521011 RepID=B8GKQ4_METPE|nr:nuclease-related domain-containing protein [Methanosphaerula palustris]ACL17200.1 hypothetical protein Mpal_1895 [Methanosphaerula palustris E1-9c]